MPSRPGCEPQGTPVKPSARWTLLALLLIFVLLLGSLSVAAAQDGDAAVAAQGGGAALVLLGLCYTIYRRLRSDAGK